MLTKKLSKDVIETWPEIFEEVSLNVVPIKYLCSVHIKFKDKKVWNIDIKPKDDWQFVEHNIREFVRLHKTKIESVDFKLDTERIKNDVTKLTNKFLKRRLK